LDAFHRLATLHHPSFFTTTRNNQSHQQALVAATELRATYEAADMSRISKVSSKPYILHTVDDTNIPVVVSTGASVSVTPLVSDFVGPIPKPSRQSLQGLGDSTKVDGQGIIEWQIQDVLGPPIPPEPPPPPLIRSSSEGDVVPSVVDALDFPPTVIPEGATSSSEGDDEQRSKQEVTSEKETVELFTGARSSSEGGIDSDPKETSSPEGGIDSAPVIDPDQSVVQQDSSPKSKYWDEDRPAKRRRRPNPKYAHHLRTAKVKLGDLNQAVLMGLDWKTNLLNQLDSHYSQMLAQFHVFWRPRPVKQTIQHSRKLWIRRVSSQEQGSQFALPTVRLCGPPNFKETKKHRQWSPNTPRYRQQCGICYRYENILSYCYNLSVHEGVINQLFGLRSTRTMLELCRWLI
jgi:hypothetical protein